jgi:hypothetical protein
MSGWQDSNLRPPAPKAGAITGLRYTPKRCYNQYFLFASFGKTIRAWLDNRSEFIRRLVDDPFWLILQLAFRPLTSLAKFLNRKIWKQASNLSLFVICLADTEKPLRREGDSNPRYRFQYGSLANYWYKPLTHLSSMYKNGSLAVWECKYSIID